MAAAPVYEKHFLADFCRRQWASARARALWEPRIASIGEHFHAAERRSVEVGIRSAALQTISPDQLAPLSIAAATSGLVAIPLEMHGRASSYAAGSVALEAGAAWDYRVVVVSRSAAAEFVVAFRERDDDTIGRLLGYPDCCRRFFARTWAAGSVDPTWEMDARVAASEGSVQANILLRWLGVRYVPHMPCAFNCGKSTLLGHDLRELIPAQQSEWADVLLSMPTLWSALNGIGTLTTPIVTVNFRSDVSHELREIRREGTHYPEAGEHGLQFPYRPPPSRRVDERLWKDNGFRSLEAMSAAHETIASLLPSPTRPRMVVDLGCGNGVLARKLAGADGKAYGVELVDDVATRAGKYLNEVLCGDLRDPGSGWERWPVSTRDLILLMPGRLVETPSTSTITRLRGSRAPLLVYAYGDWIEKYGSLEALCHAAGLEGKLSRGGASGDGVVASFWLWSVP